MNNADTAALLTSAAFAGWLWYSSPTRSLSTPCWLAFFSVICFKDEIRWTLEESVPWLSPLNATGIIVLCLFFYILGSRLFGRRSTTHHGAADKTPEQDGSECALRPLFFPARTTHSRFFPQKHSFSYSYLLVGIPVGWRGALRSYLTVDLPYDSPASSTVFSRSWFSVDADDYLERGSESLGLQGKLHSYLESQVGQFSLPSCTVLKTCRSGRSHRWLLLCVSRHCSSIPRLFLQSRLFLVLVRRPEGA